MELNELGIREAKKLSARILSKEFEPDIKIFCGAEGRFKDSKNNIAIGVTDGHLWIESENGGMIVERYRAIFEGLMKKVEELAA
jgi:hypothetical protein